MTSTLVHLVRHGAHSRVGSTLAGRGSGIHLDEEGRRQAARVAEILSTRPVQAVLSSPQPRATETAALIAARHGLDVTVEAGLDELDFGDWEGESFAALANRQGWQAWNRARSLAVPPRGELMIQAQARALAVLLRTRQRWPEGDVVLAGHQDVLRAALLAVLGAPLDLFGRIALMPGGRAALRLWADHAQLEALDNGP